LHSHEVAYLVTVRSSPGRIRRFFHATHTAVAAVLSLLIARLFATTSSHVLALLVFDARLGLRGVTPVNQIGFLDVHKGSPFAPFK